MATETYIEHIIKFMTNNNHTGFDFKEPFIKPSLRYVYPLFMFLHASVGVAGVAGNAGMMIIIGMRRLYQDQTYFLMSNLALADLIKCMIVLPITLANLLIQNWLFGSFLCFFLPMLQCFPVHASMLTFLTIAVDRYRLIVHPFKSRLPAGLCIIAVWVGAACVVLPYAIYIKYIDLGASLGDEFTGVGICYVYVEKRIEEYIRAMFVILYAMPLAVITLLYVRISAEIKAKETVSISVQYAQSSTMTNTDHNYPHGNNLHITWFSARQHPQMNSQRITSSTSLFSGDKNNALLTSKLVHQVRHQVPSHYQLHSHGTHRDISSTVITERQTSHSNGKSYNERPIQDSDEEMDTAKEKRTQNYLITMTTLFAMCWCPLHILILVNYFVHENETNTSHYDITYILFTWFGFLSTCITPVLFASWFMSDATKDRLMGYFRFSNRRLSATYLQRQRCQSRLSEGAHNIHFEEGVLMECGSIERYDCDLV